MIYRCRRLPSSILKDNDCTLLGHIRPGVALPLIAVPCVSKCLPIHESQSEERVRLMKNNVIMSYMDLHCIFTFINSGFRTIFYQFFFLCYFKIILHFQLTATAITTSYLMAVTSFVSFRDCKWSEALDSCPFWPCSSAQYLAFQSLSWERERSRLSGASRLNVWVHAGVMQFWIE